MMNTLVWIPCATIILMICIVQAISLTCNVTLCSITNFCENGKECQQDPNTCQEECICTDVTLCGANEVKISTKLATTQSMTITTVPVSQSTDCLSNYTKNTMCDGGFPCVYGNCNIDYENSIWQCICYPGAFGEFCDDSCCLDCGRHGSCVVSTLDNSPFCNCLPDYTGEDCSILKSTKLATTHSMTITTVPVSQSTDCLSNYIKNTMCDGGFPCLYGNCTIDYENSIWQCICYPGAVGEFCQDSCCLDCGPHGSCVVSTLDNSPFCNCLPDYTGEVCSILKSTLIISRENTTNQELQEDEETWYLWIVGVCALVLLVLLLLLIVLPYQMWKHRFILVMKIVHYFQPYEDQDDRVWDAFVSYSSDPFDETFVLRQLIPTLEKEMNFKLNIHFRDFAVGETVANNITQSVQNSRRTILVMSKNYVKSEFTRLEYQCAQQEMLQRKHRIIPVLLEDIAEIKDTIDPTLKLILNSVTYIEWPGEKNPKELQKFWKRLELSMPKMRKVKTERMNVKQDVPVWLENIVIHPANGKKVEIGSTLHKINA